MKKPIGLQLYTLRKECEQDFIGTLEKVATLGFEGVEFAGYYDLEAQTLKSVLEHLGMQAVASHIPLHELEKNLDKVIAYQHVIGSRRMVCPYLPSDRRTEEDYRQLVDLLNRIGETCDREGITFCYHNHDFELRRLSDNRTALDMLLDETNPAYVHAELDIFWLKRAGHDPVQWIKKYQGRTPLIHLKDMTSDADETFAELGTGGIDLQGVLKQEPNAGVEWWIVEQDVCQRPALESVDISLRYLHHLRD
nr:sugar phosphate isomerase/epimerase [Caldalkalibacillus salinus]